MTEIIPNVETKEKTTISGEYKQEKEKVNKILFGFQSVLSEVSTEKSLMESDEDLLKKHNTSFATLLSNYVTASDKSQKHKRGMKIGDDVIIKRLHI